MTEILTVQIRSFLGPHITLYLFIIHVLNVFQLHTSIWISDILVLMFEMVMHLLNTFSKQIVPKFLNIFVTLFYSFCLTFERHNKTRILTAII